TPCRWRPGIGSRNVRAPARRTGSFASDHLLPGWGKNARRRSAQTPLVLPPRMIRVGCGEESTSLWKGARDLARRGRDAADRCRYTDAIMHPADNPVSVRAVKTASTTTLDVRRVRREM